MPGDSDKPITVLLQEWRSGSSQALERLLPLVQRELHQVASRHLSRERRDHTLQATALIHEAYLRLAGQPDVDWQGRAHFFGVAAQVMRHILVDHARRQGRVKRGGRVPHVALGDVEPAAPAPLEPLDAYALDRALSRLEAFDPGLGRLVELRFFAGLTIDETAEVMGISSATVKREWTLARTWLFRDLAAAEPAG